MISQDKIIAQFLEQSAVYFGLKQDAAAGPEADTLSVPDYLLCTSAYPQRQVTFTAGAIR
jgi:hypothetical protein